MGTGGKILKVMWRLFRAYFFYPGVIAIMLWLYFTDAHWIWGLALLVAVLILDPIWRLIAKRVISWRPHPRDE